MEEAETGGRDQGGIAQSSESLSSRADDVDVETPTMLAMLYAGHNLRKNSLRVKSLTQHIDSA